MPDATGLGPYLRERRVRKGMTIEDVHQATRVSPRVLVALEHDRLVELPPPVFARGFIRSYCACLGEDPERALAAYEAVLRAEAGRAQAAAVGVRRPHRRRHRLGVLAALLALGGAAVALLLAGAIRTRQQQGGITPPRVERPAASQAAPPVPRGGWTGADVSLRSEESDGSEVRSVPRTLDGEVHTPGRTGEAGREGVIPAETGQ